MSYVYGAIAIACVLMGAILMRLYDDSRYAALHSQLQSLQAADDKGRADRLAIENKALSNNLAKAQAVAQGNAEVIHELQSQAAAIQADRDTLAGQLGRVLASGKAGPGSGHLPQSTGVPGTAPAASDPGASALAGLVADAITECRSNNANYRTLTTELKPQL